MNLNNIKNVFTRNNSTKAADYQVISVPNYFEEESKSKGSFFTNLRPAKTKEEKPAMETPVRTRINLNVQFSMLRTSLQEALDSVDILLYAQQGNPDVASHIKKCVDRASDKQALITAAEDDLADSIDTTNQLATKVLKRVIREKELKAQITDNPKTLVEQAKSAKAEKELRELQMEDHSTTVLSVVDQSVKDHAVQEVSAQTFEAELYLFEAPAEVFDSSKFFCKVAAKAAAELGIQFKEGEPISWCVFWSPEDRDKQEVSWQDHELPRKLQEALGLDLQIGHFAPRYLPLQMLQELAHKDLMLEPKKGVHIKITKAEKQGAHLNGTYAETLATITEAWNNRQTVEVK